MLGLILLISLVYLMGTTFGDDAGVAAISVAILILIVLFCRGWSSTSRAYGNWVRYWSRGELPEREVTRRRVTHRSTRRVEKPAEVSAEERAEAARKRAEYREKVTVRNLEKQGKETAVCHYCGRIVHPDIGYVLTKGGWMRAYQCPNCGSQNTTKLGCVKGAGPWA